MCVHADSLFTSLGDPSYPEYSSSIEVHGAISVNNCMFENAITTQGPSYILSYDSGAVRMEGNTFDATAKMFQFYVFGTLPAPNYLFWGAQPFHHLKQQSS
jgi:hypothetical protein